MKCSKLITIIVGCLLLLPMLAAAQKLTVEKMEVAPMDLSASTMPRNDLNGNPCGLVKVQLASPGASFEGNVIGDAEFKKGEYWVYMTEGSYMLNVKHASFLPLFVNFRDYDIKKVAGKTTYVLTLVMPQGNAPVQTQKLTINYSPVSAMVIVDSKPYQGNGRVEVELPVGSHDYQIVAIGYASAEGSVKLNADMPRTVTEHLVATTQVAQQQQPPVVQQQSPVVQQQQPVVQQSQTQQVAVSTSSVSPSSSELPARTVRDFTLISGKQPERYSIVVGSFTVMTNAEAVSNRLSQKGYSNIIIKDKDMFRVIGATTNDPNMAKRLRDELRNSYPHSWVMVNPNAKENTEAKATEDTPSSPVEKATTAREAVKLAFEKDKLFKSEDSYDLSDSGKDAINRIVSIMQEDQNCHIGISVFITEKGTKGKSQYANAYRKASLFPGRYKAIADYLQSRGINKDRIHELNHSYNKKLDAELYVYVP